MMSITTQSKFVFVFIFVAQILVTLYRAIRWLLFDRTSRIARLAHQLEQINVRDNELSDELARLNEQYLAESSRIQQRRHSLALQRAQVLDELSQRVESNGAPVPAVKSVPLVKCETVPIIKAPQALPRKPKPAEPLKLAPVVKSTSNTSLAVARWESKSRSPSPCLWQRPKTPDVPTPATIVEPFAARKIIKLPKRAAAELVTPPAKEETKEVTTNESNSTANEQTVSNFSKLTGFNLATHRVNEYIDLIVESTIREFRSSDEDLSSCNKKSERFRDSIKELYGDPEWRPFINDLKKQYKIFCFL